MKFWLTLDGKRQCFQAVNRNGNIYYRRCADTMYYPTPGQIQVRTILMEAAHNAALENKSRDELLEDVANAPYHINPFRKNKYTLTDYMVNTYQAIAEYAEVREHGKTKNIHIDRQAEHLEGNGAERHTDEIAERNGKTVKRTRFLG